MTGTSAITIRRGTDGDTPAVYRVLWEAINDLARRTGTDPIPGEMETAQARSEPVFRHLAETAAEFWVATDAASGEIVAYARSIEHGGFLELTEFFVLPGRQSAGIGRQLLERAFPDDRGDLRVIVATTDVRALSRYARAGMTARTVIASLVGDAPPATGAAERMPERIDPSAAALDELARLDREVAGFDRGPHLAWLARRREAYLFRRDGRPLGYAFVGADGVGPIGALEADELPAIIDLTLGRATAAGATTLSFEVPMTNGVALRHLLARGFRIDSFLTLLLSNRQFGRMDRYIGFSPPIFL